MRGASFDPREVEAERHVIAEERARDLDSPLGRLDQTHMAVAYLRHPYRNPILGWPDDLARIGVDDLRDVLPGALPARRRGPGRRRRRGPRGGARPGRGPLRVAGARRLAARRADLRRAPPDGPARLLARRVRGRGAGHPGLAHRAAGAPRRAGARRGLGPADVRPEVAALGRPGRARQGRHLGRDGAGGGASGRAVPRPGRGRPRRRDGPGRGGDRRDPRPAGRRGAVGRRAGAVEAPARGRLALGAGRPGGPGLGAGPRRALGRLARLAGRAPRGHRRRGRRRPPRHLDLPDRLEPDRRLVLAPPRPGGDGAPADRDDPAPASSRRAAERRAPDRAGRARTASRGSPTSARIARPSPTG